MGWTGGCNERNSLLTNNIGLSSSWKIFCIVSYHIISYCIISNHIVLCCVVLSCIILYCIVCYVWYSGSWCPSHRLHTQLGISGVAHDWYWSHLSGRNQTFNLSGVSSSTRALKYGIPQGSVLEPFLFSVNLLPLRKIITDHGGVSYELYADDNQLYIVFNRTKGDITNITLGSVISDTRHWLTMNFQKVNDGKTQTMHINLMLLQHSLLGMKSLQLQIPLGTWTCSLIPKCILTNILPVMLKCHLQT